MFKAVNTECEAERKKAVLEKKKIQNTYLSALKTLDIQNYLEIKVVFEQNVGFYLVGKANLLHSLVRKASVEELDEIMEKYGIIDVKLAVFEAAKKFIGNGLFVKARKLLNIAREKAWWCNDLFDLEERIKREYFPGYKLVKPCKFEDFL